MRACCRTIGLSESHNYAVSDGLNCRQHTHIIYIYTYTWKPIKTKCSVRMGLDSFFVGYVFSKYGRVQLKTLCLQVNSFSEILDLSDWFRQNGCLVWRQYLGRHVDICLLCLKRKNVYFTIFYGYITSKFAGKYGIIFVAIFGYPITTPNLLHFGLLFSSFGDCRRMAGPSVGPKDG